MTTARLRRSVTEAALDGSGQRVGGRAVGPRDRAVLHLARGGNPRGARRDRPDESDGHRSRVAVEARGGLRKKTEVCERGVELAGIIRAGSCDDVAVGAAAHHRRGQRGAGVIHRHRQRLGLWREARDGRRRVRGHERIDEHALRRIGDGSRGRGTCFPAGARVAGSAVAAVHVRVRKSSASRGRERQRGEGSAHGMAIRATGRDASMVEGLPAPVGVATKAAHRCIGIGGDALVQLIGQHLIVVVAGRAVELAERRAVAVAGVALDRVRAGGDRKTIMRGRGGRGVGRRLRFVLARDGEEREETRARLACRGQRDLASDHRVVHGLPRLEFGGRIASFLKAAIGETSRRICARRYVIVRSSNSESTRSARRTVVTGPR